MYTQKKLEEEIAKNNIWFGPDGNSAPRKKKFLSEVTAGVTPETLWLSESAGTNDEAKKETNNLFEGTEFFDTPKPERLIQRIFQIASNPGDLVLDSFLGSGTTAAVAHKMGRRWIGVELGDHCYTHCQVRLDKVVDGEDAGGITESVGWKGGGGYRFYELAPTLIKEDQWGQPVINTEYKAEQLSEAVCKLEGFTYEPSATEYFIHGHSTERDFIWVTTGYLTAAHQRALGDLLGPERSLLVCCKGFERGTKVANLTVKKIPQAVLHKCEWGHDDYSLNVENLPMAAKVPEQGTLLD